MYGFIVGLMLTTFISQNGLIQEVSADSPQVIEYQTESVTDIGNPDNLESAQSIESVSDGDSVGDTVGQSETIVTYVEDNSEEVALLNEAVMLLAENSSTATGTINTTILDMMDRIIDDYPDYYKYAGFRIDADDSYRTTLYIAKKADVSGNAITFSDDCIAVNFYRTTSSSYNGYTYYEVTDSPSATVDISSKSIVYTNCLKGYPTLGSKEKADSSYIWVFAFIAVTAVLIIRRKNSD